MSLWPRLRAALNGGGATNPDEGAQSSGPLSFTNVANVSVSDDRALAVSTVFACARLITTSVAMMPLGFYRRTPDGRVPLPEDDPLVSLLKYRPNPMMTGKQLRSAMLMSRVLWGNAYAEKKYNNGRLVSITPLKPAFMEVSREPGGLKYHYSTANGVREYAASEIMHIKGPSPDGVIGLSPLSYMRHALSVTIAAETKAATSFAGRPNAVLKTQSWPNQEQREQLRQHYGNLGTDGTGDGQWWLLPGDMQYQTIGMPPDDLQMLESRMYQVADLCRFFGVPSVMVDGHSGNTAAWPASYEQQVLSFLTFTLKGYIEEFEDSISHDLIDPKLRREVYAEHSVEGFLRTDSAGRAAFYSSGLQNGWLTRNEVRALENLPRVDGGDDLTAQLNLAPIQNLGDTDVA